MAKARSVAKSKPDPVRGRPLQYTKSGALRDGRAGNLDQGHECGSATAQPLPAFAREEWML
jgi:hypothetical protein